VEYFGYAGRILRVNLSDESVDIVPLPKDLAREYIGGRSINTRILYDEVPAGRDPFDPENRVILGTGPLVVLAGITPPRSLPSREFLAIPIRAATGRLN
jgi:aldehyde:ferredoxin oxidoreductase